MNRPETLRKLDKITEMSDQEIAENAAWIRDVASKAHMHINVLRGDRNRIKQQKNMKTD